MQASESPAQNPAIPSGSWQEHPAKCAKPAYAAPVVLIQRGRTLRAILPVQTRNILVQTLDRSMIEDVSTQTAIEA